MSSDPLTVSASAANRTLIACIGDSDSVTGLLMSGIGSNQPPNFMIVDSKTTSSEIQTAFDDFTTRENVAIVLINQHVAEKIRPSLEGYTKVFPALLEIPSKDHPYEPEKDSILKRVRLLLGE